MVNRFRVGGASEWMGVAAVWGRVLMVGSVGGGRQGVLVASGAIRGPLVHANSHPYFIGGVGGGSHKEVSRMQILLCLLFFLCK